MPGRAWAAVAALLGAAEPQAASAQAGWKLVSKNIQVDGQDYKQGWSLQMDQGGDLLSLDFIKEKGALIQAFSLNGKSVLLNGDDPSTMDGSTFWISPQSAWGWPPPAELNSMAFEAVPDEANAMVTLTSEICQKLGVQVKKTFHADELRGGVLLDFEITNKGSQNQKIGAWQISRVKPHGLSFYKTGKEAPNNGDGTFANLQVTTEHGATWFQQDPNVPKKGKLFADTQGGWLAHVAAEDKLLFIKCFGTFMSWEKSPSGEAEIELFDGKTYEEVEAQGPAMDLKPGDKAYWRVAWYLRELPPVDRQGLVDYVSGVCGSA